MEDKTFNELKYKINKITMEEISKEKFLEAYNKHLPNAFIRFIYKYFSQSTTEENMKPSKMVTAILLILFVSGFFATVLGLPKQVIGPVVIIYSVILSSLVLSMFAAMILNNLRIRKIRKLLGGITAMQYNVLADLYLE